MANCVSHGVGLLASLAAVPVLVIAAARHDGVAGVVGASVFAATMVLVYLTSTLYHAVPRGGVKQLLRILDHGAIFLLIAGTYTPFTLGVLRGAWGWTLFGMVWGLCITGVMLKALGGVRFPGVSMCLYLLSGWIVLVAAVPVCLLVPPWGLLWLLAGGVAYTGGVVFFAAQKLPYNHLAWHLCVMVGTACHFIAVLSYAS